MNGGGNGLASSGLPAIERLVGRENWHTWKFALRTFLEVEELWEAVEPIPDEQGNIPAVNAAKDRKARGKIILGLDPTLYVHVQDTKTASEAWKKLEKVFEDSGLTRKWGLLHKLITTNLDSCGSMEAYVTRMVGTAHQLNGVGLKIDEEWLGNLQAHGHGIREFWSCDNWRCSENEAIAGGSAVIDNRRSSVRVQGARKKQA